MSPGVVSERARIVADAAIVVLAERGSRSLTHRAVDEQAGLPPGATSNVARSRAALLELVVARIAVLDSEAFAGAAAPVASIPALAALLAAIMHRMMTVDRTRVIARYELTLESTRRPELRAHFDRESEILRTGAEAVIAALGSATPQRHTRQVLAYLEGTAFATCLDGQPILDPADLARGVEELLSGMLRQPVT